MEYQRKDFERYDIDYKLAKDWVFPYSQIDKDSSIILYGAGDVGQAYYSQLCVNHFCEVIAWVDKAYVVYREYDLPVDSPIVIKDKEYDYIVIAIRDALVARSINTYLLELGAVQDKIIWLGEERFLFKQDVRTARLVEPAVRRAKMLLDKRNVSKGADYAIRFIERISKDALHEEKLIIPRMVFELTTFCSLKCKNCNNLINEYHNPRHVPLDNVISDIEAITRATDKIISFELIGGEPFLYPDLDKVLEKTIASDSIMSVEITTNGTLVPDKKLKELLSNRKVTVYISKYENSRRIVELEDTLLEWGVDFEVYEDMQWVDSGGTDSRGRTIVQLRSIYQKCPSSYMCKTVHDGKMFACARAASLFDLGYSAEIEYIDLNETDLKEKIISFYMRTYSNACDYCDVVDYWRTIRAGEQ